MVTLTCHIFQSDQIEIQRCIDVILLNFDELCKHKILGPAFPGIMRDLFANQKGLPFESAATDALLENSTC